MKISNFDEYISVIRSIYTSSSIEELKLYEKELKSTSSKIDKQKKKLRLELQKNKKAVDDLRSKIRETADINAKRNLSENIKQYDRAKEAVLNKYKELNNINRFSTLSNDSKAYACSSFLLKKYLTDEILKNNPLNFSKDKSGNIIVDVDRLSNSKIYQEAIHVRDYVNSYISRYPERVMGAGYFKGLLKNIKNWNEVVNEADKFFQFINDENAKKKTKEEDIAISREGFEVVKTYKNEKMQAVNLFSESALKYEGRKMGHCVSGYYRKVKDGKSSIYSIRDDNDKGEFEPHATIEVVDGKITQIKGNSDRIVSAKYIDIVRDFTMSLSGIESLEELKNTKDIKDSELANIGFLKDKKGNIHDVFNMIEDGLYFNDVYLYIEDLAKFNLEKMNIGKLSLMGNASYGGIKALNRLASVGSVNFSKANFPNMKTIDFTVLNVSGKMCFNNVNFDNADVIKFPSEVDSLSFDNMKIKQCIDLSTNKNLSSIYIKKSPLVNINNIKFPDSVKELYIEDTKFVENIDLTNLSQMKSFEFKNVDLSEVSYVKFSKDALKTIENIDIYFDSHKVKKEETLVLLSKLSLSGMKNFKSIKISNADLSKSGKLKVSEKNEVISFLGCDVPTEKKLDFSDANLQEFSAYSSNLNDVEVIKFPKCIEYICFAHSEFNSLKELDFRNIEMFQDVAPFMSMGDIMNNCFSFEVLEDNTVIKKEKKGNRLMQGISLEFSKMNSLEKIYFPENVENVRLDGVHLESIKELDLSIYQNLKDLSVSFASLPNLEKLILPESLKNISLKETKLSPNLKIELPSNASLELINTIKERTSNFAQPKRAEIKLSDVALNLKQSGRA